MLFSGFPNIDLPGISLFALLPLILALSGRTAGIGFWASMACGAIFFLGIFRWILEVPGYTYLHHALLAVYLGSYIGLFGLIYALISKKLGITAGLAASPFIWTSIEYLRSNAAFLALPWGLLAHSQYQHPTIIQLSSVFGLWGVSFLIVSVNAGLSGLASVAIGRAKPRPVELDDQRSRFNSLLWVTAVALFSVSAALPTAIGRQVELLKGSHCDCQSSRATSSRRINGTQSMRAS